MTARAAPAARTAPGGVPDTVSECAALFARPGRVPYRPVPDGTMGP